MNSGGKGFKVRKPFTATTISFKVTKLHLLPHLLKSGKIFTTTTVFLKPGKYLLPLRHLFQVTI